MTKSLRTAAMALVVAAGASGALAHASETKPVRHAAPAKVAHASTYQRVVRQRVDARYLRRIVHREATRTNTKLPHMRPLGWNSRWLHRHHVWLSSVQRGLKQRPTYHPHPEPDPSAMDAPAAIHFWFGPTGHEDEARTVAECESNAISNPAGATGAGNGQYEGVFQMGSSERENYATKGYSNAYEQVYAAFRYSSGGSNWGPWQCLPSGGLRW